MGGPNLEIFKFSLYLFVPIFALVHFGDPAWYRAHVVPVSFACDVALVFVDISLKYRDKLFPSIENTVQVGHSMLLFRVFLTVSSFRAFRPTNRVSGKSWRG